ncbi:MAG: type II toxin-antitoxin system Phd/YefM family antitoxin [candidate division KSB1 bacterium]|nr:type II toxin-antitoxin system Phd/YefM family antitoxin [candidate division KSB1 bacterium]
MEYISKSKLKPKLLEYFRKIEETGEPVIVTSHNKPVLKIEPIQKKQRISDVFGEYWGKVRIDEDVMQPETDEWEEV